MTAETGSSMNGPPKDPPCAESSVGEPGTPAAPVSGEQPVSGAADDVAYRVVEPEPTPEALAPRSPVLDTAAPLGASTFQPAKEEETEEEIPNEPPPRELPKVDQVWTRWAEWQGPLIWVSACVGFVILMKFYLGVAGGLLLVAGLGYAAYHFVITLEVPVRVTAEHAVRQFFAALSHRLPNLCRMYLLLSCDGKRSAKFGSFGGFQSYWRDQLARLAKPPVWLKPLEFRVEGFKCRYNADKSFATVRYKLQVFPLGSAAAEPLAEFDVKNSTVKGPDGQWYLNDGTLPEATAPRSESD